MGALLFKQVRSSPRSLALKSENLGVVHFVLQHSSGTFTQPIPRVQSLHEQTYVALRTAILSGELASGERLVESQLAVTLKVSRTPIREAIRQLQRDNLVIADDNGGLCVTQLSATDAGHLYDCRMGLEELAVAQACIHISHQRSN